MSYRPKIKNDATGTVSDLALDAETLAGHDSSYYLNYNNLTNKPSIFNFTGVISTQIITIKSLETGIYLLTYNGTKKIKTAIGEASGHELILETTTTYNNILVVSKYSASINGHILPRINWKLICPYNSTTLYKGVTYQYQTEGDSGTPYWTGDVYNERFVEEDICIYYGDSSSSDANYYYPLYRDSVTTYDTSSGQINNRYINLKKGPKYAGGTKVTLNGTDKGASTASFYAPVSSGSSGQLLQSNGNATAPTWTTVTIPTKSSWNYDDMYVKYSASQSLTDAQKTQARSNIGAGTSNFTGYTSSNKLSTDYINNAAGWTSNAGTVTSVRVQAGTGLSSSTSTAQSTSLNTTISIASGYKLLTTNEYNNLLYNLGPYDTISGNTITRQTGYAQIKDLAWSKISNNRFEAVISDAEGSSDATTSDIIFSDVFSASSPNNVYYNSSSNIAAINSSKYLLIFVTSDYYSNKTVNDFLSDYGNVYIQYKLATSYTEKAITNKQLNVNSELEKDVAKNMYNLGKYDSQPVINSDNTVTITRNTGFIVADWHWTKDSDGYNNLKRYYHYFDSLLDAEYDSNGVGVFYSNYGVSDYSTKAGAYFGKANNKTFVGFLTTDDLSDSQLNALGITIQYKLATSYTEKAIYNSPVKPSSISGYKLITTAEYDSLVNQANAGLEYEDIYNSYTEVNSGTYKTLITLPLDENCVYLVVGHAKTDFHDASEPVGLWLRAYNNNYTLVDETVCRTMNHSGGGVDATMIINTKTGSARQVSCVVYNYYPGVREFAARMTVVKLVTNK